MPKKATTASLRQEASFVFKGTVLKLKATTTADIPKSDRTVVVRVDETIRAPEALAQYNGQDITVQLAGRKKVTKGQQLVFYTNGLLYGASLAVKSVDQGAPQTVHAAAATVAPDPVRNMVERDILSRASSADAVISGRVTSVRVPTDVVAAHSAVAAGGVPPEFISEHYPDWRIAEVQVDEVHKGTHGSNTAEIRFPNSNDVLWHYAPKLRTGQGGLFILHKASREKAAARAAPTDAGEYVCLNPADFQQWEKLGDLGDTLAVLSAETDKESSEG